MRFTERDERILEIMIQIMEIQILLNITMGIQEQMKDLQGPLLLTWFNFNPSMDK